MSHRPDPSRIAPARNRLWLSLVAAVAVLISACGVDSTEAPATAAAAADNDSAQEDAAQEIVEAPPEGRVALDVALEAGQPVVLWFWGAH